MPRMTRWKWYAVTLFFQLQETLINEPMVGDYQSPFSMSPLCVTRDTLNLPRELTHVGGNRRHSEFPLGGYLSRKYISNRFFLSASKDACPWQANLYVRKTSNGTYLKHSPWFTNGSVLTLVIGCYVVQYCRIAKRFWTLDKNFRYDKNLNHLMEVPRRTAKGRITWLG